MHTMFETLRQSVIEILEKKDGDSTEKMQQICDLLRNTADYYDWVGFYFKNGDKRELKLGPYAGEPTDHTIIPFGKGICGQVAESNQNFVVPDVSAQDNYIACSLTVKSEIVVPLFKNGENIGQIDIDSNTPDPFTEADERFLEFVNQKVAEIL
ncbi:Putative GAF sensor protein [Flagellimonas lutaonensis]|uniref:Putative GAF sensor protein n=2 Tax=Flagellimonas lutaonensis TaxID=516051 RepID=A0A0D5YRX6_9FLAO|nr:Putative GAF sensor protein [Allomuricauda lutaonensis]